MLICSSSEVLISSLEVVLCQYMDHSASVAVTFFGFRSCFFDVCWKYFTDTPKPFPIAFEHFYR